MNTDRYTRGVLTVIAAALLYICAMMSGVPALAQSAPLVNQLAPARPQAVVIVGWGTVSATGEIQVSTVKDRNGIVRTDANLPVKVMGAEIPLAVTLGVTPDHPLPVGLTAIDAGEPWAPIRTKVEPAPTQKTPGEPK